MNVIHLSKEMPKKDISRIYIMYIWGGGGILNWSDSVPVLAHTTWKNIFAIHQYLSSV